MYRINTLGSKICFLWVPAHVGAVGNEEVDHLANEALKWSYIEINIPLGKEVKAIIRTAIKGKWQVQWNEEERGRPLYQIQNTIGGERGGRGSRREDSIITGLLFGHTALNYSLNEQTWVWELQSMWISRNCRACINILRCLSKWKQISGGRVKRNGDRKYYNLKKLLNNGLENYCRINYRKLYRVYKALMKHLRKGTSV